MLKVYVESAAFNSIFANMSDPLTPVLPAADARRKLKSQKRSAKTLLAYSGFNLVQKPSSQVCSRRPCKQIRQKINRAEVYIQRLPILLISCALN